MRAPGVPAGGGRAAWAGREWARGHWRQETIGGDEGFRSIKRVVIWKDGEPMARECREFKENRRGQHWGVLRTGWNEAARARCHNA